MIGHPTSEILVPIKYDLGGRIQDVAATRRTVEAICGVVADDEPLLRSWNISFLGRYAPPFGGPLDSGHVHLGDSDWSYTSTLVVHPMLGIASVDFRFITYDPDVRPTAFYDDFVDFKNSNYNTYLDQVTSLRSEVREQISSSLLPDSPDTHGDRILQLRERSRHAIEARPSTYPFHDFRMFFVDRRAALDDETTNKLLMLSSEAPSDELVVDGLRLDGLHLTSTGWATVVRCGQETADRTIDDAFTLMSVVHAHWFVARVWIDIYHDQFAGSDRRHTRSAMLKLRASQFLLARDLTEAGDLTQMLKDPSMIRLGNYFTEAMGLREQINTADRRRRVLEEHGRELAEFRSANQLEALFAIAAAAGVTSLIPALAQVRWNGTVTFVTALLTGVLTLVFAVNIGLPAEWIDTIRRRRATRRRHR